VEDQQAAGLLAAMGCDAMQGFHVSPPLAPDAALRWLRERLPSLVEPAVNNAL